jgi:hypothetical protein
MLFSLFLILGFVRASQSFITLSFFVLDRFLAPALSLHVLLALLFFGNFLILNLLPSFAFVLIGIVLPGCIPMSAENIEKTSRLCSAAPL